MGGISSVYVYLDGDFLPYDQARIPVEDRGFMFADGVYEVIKSYRGRPLRLAEHLDRLARSCREVRLPLPAADLAGIAQELMTRNRLTAVDATIYIQLTRGVAPRNHIFPAQTTPTVLVICRPAPPSAAAAHPEGVAAITVPDTRWRRCDIKAIGLLPNVLAKQQAAEAGAYEALFVRDGWAVEGSSSNLFAVIAGQLTTHPATSDILHGITRAIALELAMEMGIPVCERPLPLAELKTASEVFFASTVAELAPVVQLDGQSIGAGRPGPVVRQLVDGLRGLVGPP